MWWRRSWFSLNGTIGIQGQERGRSPTPLSSSAPANRSVHHAAARASDRRLELITGSKRRRARSAREKAAIVAETFAPGANVSEIARRHRLNRGLLFSWC